MPAPAETRRRDRRLDIRTTAEERDLINRAVAATGTDVTEFVVTHACDAARHLLADRTEFVLSPSASAAWDEINRRPARTLPGLAALMNRPSPFHE